MTEGNPEVFKGLGIQVAREFEMLRTDLPSSDSHIVGKMCPSYIQLHPVHQKAGEYLKTRARFYSVMLASTVPGTHVGPQ